MNVEIEELAGRLDDGALTILDVRTPGEFDGTAGSPCDPRQGHIPGAVHVDLATLMRCASADEIRALVGAADGAEVVAYCHSGQRSAFAVTILRAAGLDARNYAGSWHEWSRRGELPLAT